jgi:SAM-dependent methyltransferase
MADAAGGQFSLWHDSAALDEERARTLSEDHLELRGRAADEIANRAAYLTVFALHAGEHVLEVGCGSGVVTRDVARRIAPDGTVTGLDPSPALLAIARELAEQEGLADLIEWREGDARVLPFPDATFDAVLAVTTLSHVPGAKRAVQEMVRVVRPGGRVGVFDRDIDTAIISHPDRAMTRRIVAAAAEQTAVNPWLCRRLPRLLAEVGVGGVGVRGFSSIERDPRGFYATNGGARWAEIAAKTGAITEEERARWVREFEGEQAAGGFMAGMTQLFVWGTRVV